MPDPNLIELVTAIIGSVAAVCAAVGTIVQLRLIKLEQRKHQEQQAIADTPDHPKVPTEGKPTR